MYQISLTEPLPDIGGASFKRLTSYIKKAIRIVDENGKTVKSKKRISKTLNIFANGCYLIDEIVRKNNKRDLNYDNLFQIVIDEELAFVEVLKGYFKYKDKLLNRFYQEVEKANIRIMENNHTKSVNEAMDELSNRPHLN